jgi:hypothetical protein
VYVLNHKGEFVKPHLHLLVELRLWPRGLKVPHVLGEVSHHEELVNEARSEIHRQETQNALEVIHVSLLRVAAIEKDTPAVPGLCDPPLKRGGIRGKETGDEVGDNNTVLSFHLQVDLGGGNKVLELVHVPCQSNVLVNLYTSFSWVSDMWFFTQQTGSAHLEEDNFGEVGKLRKNVNLWIRCLLTAVLPHNLLPQPIEEKSLAEPLGPE